jgi:SAM-dependent methyltransferase
MSEQSVLIDLFKDHTNNIKIWNELFCAQVDASFALELPSFYRSAAWHSASRVADVGTGNGYFLSKLVAAFKDKRYRGIDKSQRFIELASGLGLSGVDFACIDFYDEAGSYDFAILRAVVQHQPDFTRLLEQLSTVVRPGGAALIIDQHDRDGVYFWPPVHAMMDFYVGIGRWQRNARALGSRNLSDLVSLASSSEKWTILADECVVVPSTLEGNTEIMKRQCSLVIAALWQLDRDRRFCSDYARLEDEWVRWCALPVSFMQMALRVIELARR